jgi:hypothetical protein
MIGDFKVRGEFGGPERGSSHSFVLAPLLDEEKETAAAP